jgi:hypothetical protein
VTIIVVSRLTGNISAPKILKKWINENTATDLD